MAVTCPSCEARYRMAPERLADRGARIKCPRCGHAFVVFKEDLDAAPAPSMDLDRATTTGAFEAVGLDPTEVPVTGGSIRVVAPGPRKGRAVIARHDTSSNLQALLPGDAAPDAAAEDLDWKAVGIRTWKIKVVNGLTYDFSDVPTLKRYLADKKVGREDQLGHKSVGWTRLGDIEDLDGFFLDAWQRLRDEQPVAELPDRRAGDAVPTLARRTGDAVPTLARRTGDAVPSVGARPTRRAATPAPPPLAFEPSARRPWVLGLGAAAALALGAGLALWQNGGRQQQVSFEPPLPADDSEPTPSLAERLADERRRLIADPAPDEYAPDTPHPAPVPVVPPEARYRRPDPIVQRPTPAPVIERSASDRAAPYLAAGRKQLARGNFGGARTAFERAVSIDPATAAHHEALAQALVKLGEPDLAALSLLKAQQIQQANVAR